MSDGNMEELMEMIRCDLGGARRSMAAVGAKLDGFFDAAEAAFKTEKEPEPPALHLEVDKVCDLCIKFGNAVLGYIEEESGKCFFINDAFSAWEAWRDAGFPVQICEDGDNSNVVVEWQGKGWWLGGTGILCCQKGEDHFFSIFDFVAIHAFVIAADNGFIQTYPNGRVRSQ